jgi:Tfp pilus assembly protein PilZ
MFEIKGEVVWVRNYSDGDNKLPGMGIKFKDIDKETQEFIIKYVNNKIK